jgi:hypothetical protein
MPDQLPEKVPPGWLDQIREVVKSEKPRLWLVLLTSSVMAAVIAAASSYWAVERKITADKELETIKSRLEIEKDNARSRIAAYNKLSQNLNTFAERLEGFANFVQISGRDRPTPERVAHMQRELRAVGLSEQAVNDARNDPLLNGTRAQQMAGGKSALSITSTARARSAADKTGRPHGRSSAQRAYAAARKVRENVSRPCKAT